MSRIDWRNMSLRIFSLLLALLLWFYVSNEQNPVNEQIMSIKLQQNGLENGLAVSGIPSNVSIRVQGTRSQIANLTPTDFEAVIDLSKFSEGEHHIPVTVNSPSGIQVVQIIPSRVYVVLDSFVEQKVNVVATITGIPSKGYYALDPMVVPGVVTIAGPRSKVNAISQISVAVDVEAAVGTIQQTVPVGGALSGVNVYPQSVSVTVPVNPLSTKTVAVRPKVIGEPAEGYEISAVSVNPSSVQMTAPSGVLSGISYVDTERIDIKNIDRDFTIKASIIPPVGAVEVRPSSIEVTVQLKKIKNDTPGDGGTITPGEGT